MRPVSNSASVVYLAHPGDVDLVQSVTDALTAAGGGLILFEPGTYNVGQFVLKEGVVYAGLEGLHLVPPGNSTGVKFVGTQSGAIIDTPATQIEAAGIYGINFHGQADADAGDLAIRLRLVRSVFVEGCVAREFAEQFILVNAGIDLKVRNCRATNCLLQRTRAARTGVIDLGGTDHSFHDVELSAGQTAITDTTLYNAALAVRGNSSNFVMCTLQNCDTGLWVASTVTPGLNTFVGVRNDLNFGHGAIIDGIGNTFLGGRAYRNGRAADNTYSGWQFNGGRNRTHGLNSWQNKGGDTPDNDVKYGLEDTVSSGIRNKHYGFWGSIGYGTNEVFYNGNGANLTHSSTVMS